MNAYLFIFQHVKIPVIANGGSSNNRTSFSNTHEGIKQFWKESGASSVMIARACEWNPSVFRRDGDKEDIFNIIHKYLDYAIHYDYPFTFVKYNVQQLLGSHQESTLGKQFLASSTMYDLCKAFNREQDFEKRKEYIRSESQRLGFSEMLSSSSSPIKTARRDPSIKNLIPRIRSLKEISESGKHGNIDDNSLADEIMTMLPSNALDNLKACV